MKNLKKILMAFVLVALLISSAVTVALAEASYTGTVAEATELLNGVDAAIPESGESVADVKAAPLAKVHSYLTNTPVNPKDDGYAAMIKKYNDYTLAIMYLKLNAIDLNQPAMDLSADLADVYAYIASAPISASKPGEYKIALGYKCANENCGTFVKFSDSELFAGITEFSTCIDGCSTADMNLVLDNFVSYAEIETKLGEASVGVTSTLIDAIYGCISADNNYYELLSAQNMAVDFINQSLKLEYVPPISNVYTGDVKEVADMLAAIDADVDFAGYSEALAAVYTYLVETPVNPTTVEYYEFLAAYEDSCELLVEKLDATVTELGSPAEKIELLAAFRELLAGKAAVEEDAEAGIAAAPAVSAVPFSQKVVESFNGIREKVMEEFRAASDMLIELPELDDEPLTFEYDEITDQFVADINILKALGVEDAKSPVYLASLYENYIKILAFDLGDEECAAYIEEYKALACEYVTKNYIEEIDNLVQVGEKYTVLVEFHTFVAASPLCEEVVDLYNNARIDLRGEAVALNEKIGTHKLPTYVEPEQAGSTVSYSVLNKFLSALQDSYESYIAASAEDKAAKFAVMQKSATDIYYYIKGSVINTSDAEYQTFIAEYSALRESISEEIVNLIVNAEDESQLEAIALAKSFVSNAPLSFAMVDAYNSAVKTALDSDADAYLVGNIYYDILAGIAVLEDDDATNEEILDAGYGVQTLINKIYDVTDPMYADAKKDFASACEVIGDIIYVELSYAITYLPADEVGPVSEYYFNYVDHVYTFETVMGLRKALKSTGDICTAIIEKIDNNFADVAVAENVYVEIFDKIADFDAAESIEEKFNIYVEIYNAINFENRNTFFMAGTSYAAVSAEFDRVTNEMKDLLIGLLNITLSPAQLGENLKLVGAYVDALCFSAEVVDAYNEIRQESIDMEFAQYIGVLEQDCVALSYVSPEGFSTSFSRIYIALELASAELAAGNTDFEEYLIAYRILAANTEYYGEQVFDFGSSDFLNVISIFNKVTNQVGDYWLETINDESNSFEETALQFAAFQKFVEDNPFSKTMVESYNEARIVLYNKYRSDASKTFDGYQLLMKDLHNHIAACNVKESALSSYVKAKYNVLKTLIEAAEYGEVRGYLNHFDNLEGDLALLYQNIIKDKLHRYSTDYGLGSYNDASLTIANLQHTFYKFVENFEAEIADLSDEQREQKIRIVGAAFAEASLPSELIRIFNSKFGTTYTSKYVERGDEPGSLIEFGEYMNAINAATSTAEARIAFVEAAAYLNTHAIDAEDIQDSIAAEISNIEDKLEENTEAAKYELNKKVKLSEYNLPLQVNLHHEDSKLYTTSLSPSSDTSVRYHTLGTDYTGNKYAMIQTTTSTSPYFDLKKTTSGGTIDDSNSLVIELDVMSPDPLNFQLAWTEDGLTYGGRVTTKVLKFTNGKLDYLFGLYSTKQEQYFENYVEGVHDPIVAVPGEWMHITIAMDLDAMMYEILVDYVSLGKRPIIAGQGTKEDICRYTALRFQTTKAPTRACYDNVQIYGGSSYRSLDFFEKMGADEKFEYYANYALDENANAVNRIFAYTEANSLLSYISDNVDPDIVNNFKAYDESYIRESAEKTHFENLEELVAKVDIDSLTSGTVAEQNASISAALAYIDANRLYIDQSDPRFIAINEELVEANAKIQWLKDLDEYLDLISRFHRATSYASLVRHYEKVQEYYLLCELNKSDKAAAATIDPLATTFVNKMNADASVIELVGEVDFISYYTEYMPARMQAQLYLENSYKILDCIGFIESIVPNKEDLSYEEYLEVLGAKALENYDFVDAYMTVIRNLVNADAYVASVDGIDEALEIFNVLDEVFFNRLQEIHYSVIKNQLDKYTATNSYIEKAGICAYVENYIEENNVDMTDALGVQYLYALEVYKAELETYKIDYEAILAANTMSFLGIVSKMQTYVTYAELKPLYDLAIEKYYYNMNANSDEVKAAIQIFEEKEAQLVEWETNGAMLIGYSENLTSRRQAQKYRALVNCANYIDKVDAGVEGVSRVIDLYNRTLAEYNASIEVVNEEVSEVSDLVYSVRSESIASTVLAIVKNLFN